MTVIEFCEKYSIEDEEQAGLKVAAKYWATANFSEKLLIQIYVRTFGIYPAGIDDDPALGQVATDISEINDDLVSELTTWSSSKLSGILDYALFEQSFYSGLL